MGLLEEQMAERRARILEAARQLIADGGFEQLTMRQLAETARVSVPTVYNLIGNKYLLLEALLKEQLCEAAAAMAKVPSDASMVELVSVMPNIAHDVLFARPNYTRALIHVFLTSEDSSPMRRALDAQCIAMMAESVRVAQGAGVLCEWADAELVGQAMYAVYVFGLLGWASGELEEEVLRLSTPLRMGFVLLGLCTGDARRELEQWLSAQQTSIRQRDTPPQKGA